MVVNTNINLIKDHTAQQQPRNAKDNASSDFDGVLNGKIKQKKQRPTLSKGKKKVSSKKSQDRDDLQTSSRPQPMNKRVKVAKESPSHLSKQIVQFTKQDSSLKSQEQGVSFNQVSSFEESAPKNSSLLEESIIPVKTAEAQEGHQEADLLSKNSEKSLIADLSKLSSETSENTLEPNTNDAKKMESLLASIKKDNGPLINQGAPALSQDEENLVLSKLEQMTQKPANIEASTTAMNQKNWMTQPSKMINPKTNNKPTLGESMSQSLDDLVASVNMPKSDRALPVAEHDQEAFSDLFQNSQGMNEVAGEAANNSTVESASAFAEVLGSETADPDAKIENMQDIVRQARTIVKDGGGEMQIHLQPEGMGKVHLKVAVNEGVVNVEMMTDNQVAKQAIEEGLIDIKQALEGQKLAVETLKVEMSPDYQKDFSDLSNHMMEQENRDFAEQFMDQFRQDRELRQGGMLDGFRGFQPDSLDPELTLNRERAYSIAGKGRSLNVVA